MSYDIFVQDLPPAVTKVSDIPETFKPAIVGKRTEIMKTIKEVAPDAVFSDAGWGRVEGRGWSVEINLGAKEDCSGLAFHVRGCDEALGVVDAILRALNLRALDPQSSTGLFTPHEARTSFR